jgi:hypothetical protein
MGDFEPYGQGIKYSCFGIHKKTIKWKKLGTTSKVLEVFEQTNYHKKSFFMMSNFIYFCMVTWDVY